jgi:hypothetical protein
LNASDREIRRRIVYLPFGRGLRGALLRASVTKVLYMPQMAERAVCLRRGKMVGIGAIRMALVDGINVRDGMTAKLVKRVSGRRHLILIKKPVDSPGPVNNFVQIILI